MFPESGRLALALVLTVAVMQIPDDIASSARTLDHAVEGMAQAGGRPPICVVIQPVFAGPAFDNILRAGAARIVTTHPIPHPAKRSWLVACWQRRRRKFSQALTFQSLEGPNRARNRILSDWANT